jgi:hypothetical protein
MSNLGMMSAVRGAKASHRMSQFRSHSTSTPSISAVKLRSPRYKEIYILTAAIDSQVSWSWKVSGMS